MSVQDDWKAARRVFILRLLIKVGGEGSAEVIFTGLEHGGFARDTPDTYRADLEHLVHFGCLTEEWYEDVRVMRLSERGRMAAEGRIEVQGVAQSAWKATS
jgi:hypothetical protein